jgi:dCMP deaminase
MENNIDINWMRWAYDLAENSPDKSTQVGAVIVDGDRAIGEGFNQFPRGASYTAERWERPTKYAWIEHAERNAIYDCARYGQRAIGTTMYATGAACADCARAIVQAGITRVVTHPRISHGAWGVSVAIGDQIMLEGGVKLEVVTFKVGKSIIMEGQKVEM